MFLYYIKTLKKIFLLAKKFFKSQLEVKKKLFYLSKNFENHKEVFCFKFNLKIFKVIF